MNFYPLLVYVFVTTFTPGPNNILSMSYGMHYGYRRILRFLMGIFAGFTLLMLLCGLLNVFLVNLLPQVEFGLKIFGALYMTYLAVHIILSKPSEDGDVRWDMNSFRAGFTLQFVNLKAILYGVTVYSMIIALSFQNLVLVSVAAFLLAVISFTAASCWALGGNLFRSLLRRYFRWFNLAMGGLLIYTAIASLF